MSNQTNISPAVRSLQNEQHVQERTGQEGDLDKALEDTFPASDPISSSSTGVPTGRANRSEADQSVFEREHGGGRHFSGRRNASGRPSERVSKAVGSIDGYVADIESRIREKPLAAAAIVAGIAWLYGRTR